MSFQDNPSPGVPTPNLKAVIQTQANALNDLKRTKRLLSALRGLAEDRAEKSIIVAVGETADRALKSVSELGTQL